MDTGSRDAVRELNQYKQNNAALQKQIESLMAKLNQSKKTERDLATSLEETEKNCTEWQQKASKVEQLEKGAATMQNTIDHLEHRLEVANCEKLDAEEQLFNVQSQRSPFDPTPPKLQMPTQNATNRQSAHTSMSTIFSSGSPTSHANDPQDASTLAAFIAHIERLQEQLKQKDSRIAELEVENQQKQAVYERLERDHKELSLESDIQGHLLKKTKETDIHIDQLRTAIIDRESVIGEKEKSLRMAERQLEHHKLLLHAEIRRHATISLFADAEDDPLPDLTSLASKDDIDRWITRLQARLKKDLIQSNNKAPAGGLETIVDDLRKEIDFYVREIIYYKLDIKGYKSDIKKLKHIATRMGSYGSRASDLESPTPSLCRSADTPIRARFSAGTPGLGISNTPSPISTGPISATLSVGRPVTPPPNLSSVDTLKPTLATQKRVPQELNLKSPMTPQTPPRRAGINPANQADNIDPGISPRSVARLSPERRKPTVREPLSAISASKFDRARQPPSPDQEKFGDMATNFPLSTPAAPKRLDTQRSMSDSIIQLYAAPRTPERSPPSRQKHTPVAVGKNNVPTRERSATLPTAVQEKTTPERPPRPQYGLFESPNATTSGEGLSTPPRTNVLAEAMRNSPDRVKTESRPQHERKLSEPSTATIRGLSSSQLPRTGSAGSGSAIPQPPSHRPRAGSAGSSTTAIAQLPSPQRKLSNGSGSNFIIAMPSPHNPALISPATVLPQMTGAITGKSGPAISSQVQSPTSRAGVGGTMASSTPLTSPIELAESGQSSYFSSTLPTAKGPPSRTGSTSHSRNVSLSSMSAPSRKERDNVPKNGHHSRNTSSNSIMTAIQSPSFLMKGKGKARKDSISNPTPLASPFDVAREDGAGGGKFGIGEAM